MQLRQKRRLLEADDACSVEERAGLPLPPQQQQHFGASTSRGFFPPQQAAAPPGGQQPNLPEAMQMLNALPESVKGCLLEAARLCGPSAGLAQEHLLTSFVAQRGEAPPGRAERGARLARAQTLPAVGRPREDPWGEGLGRMGSCGQDLACAAGPSGQQQPPKAVPIPRKGFVC